MSRGLFYQPSPPPQGESLAELRQWLVRDLQRIADTIDGGALKSLALDVMEAAPERPQQAMLMYFAAGVVGASEGTYEYRAGSWVKL